MMKIKNLRDLIEEQKDKEEKLMTEIEALELGKTEQEDKVRKEQVAQRHQEVSGTFGLLYGLFIVASEVSRSPVEHRRMA